MFQTGLMELEGIVRKFRKIQPRIRIWRITPVRARFAVILFVDIGARTSPKLQAGEVGGVRVYRRYRRSYSAIVAAYGVLQYRPWN